MDIIHISSGDYLNYEELLLQREQLKKDALHYQRAYIREFGELISRIFEKKISCISLKKSIAFCLLAKNQGQKPDIKAMKEYVEHQMTSYRQQLDEMISELNSTKNDKTISATDSQEIKAIYRRIARQLHPDLTDLLNKEPTLIELWERACLAYKCSDLQMLRETDVLIQQAISQLDGDSFTVVIPDLQEKIRALEAEIQNIITTEPYSYNMLLDDEILMSEKKADLDAEYKEYCDYEQLLKTQLELITK